ncbi:unnamed protein product [Alopecurus aequalis]
MADQEALTMTKTSAEAAAAAKRAEFVSGTAADPENQKLWRHFVRFELEDGGGIEAARAVYERILAAQPDKAMSAYWGWFLTERRVGDVDSQRRLLERWVRQLPRGGCVLGSKVAWKYYLEFEVHNGGVERVRAVGEGLVAAFPMDPHAYAQYIRALAALSRHAEAFALAKRGCKELSGWCRGHDQFIWIYMANYVRRLRAKQSTAWEDM